MFIFRSYRALRTIQFAGLLFLGTSIVSCGGGSSSQESKSDVVKPVAAHTEPDDRAGQTGSPRSDADDEGACPEQVLEAIRVAEARREADLGHRLVDVGGRRRGRRRRAARVGAPLS